jgi:hypothetical protein
MCSVLQECGHRASHDALSGWLVNVFYTYRTLIYGIEAYTFIETDFGTKMTVLCIKGKGIMPGCDALNGPPVFNFTLFAR